MAIPGWLERLRELVLSEISITIDNSTTFCEMVDDYVGIVLICWRMVRTSLVLPDPLHQRLVISARQENKPITKLVCDILDTALVTREAARVEGMYAALDKLDGIGSKGITDASLTINKTLGLTLTR